MDMIILGLHGGHDASVAVIKDGVISSFVMRERFSRIKHSSGLDKNIIQIALSDAKVKVNDIDFCAITSTQNKEIISLDKEYLDFSFRGHITGISCSLLEEQIKKKVDPIKSIKYDLRDKLFYSNTSKSFPGYYYFPEWVGLDYNSLGKIGFICEYIKVPEWEVKLRLEEIARFDLNSVSDWKRIRFGFHYPLNVYVEKRKIPGFMIHHHLAHAASSYYCYPYTSGAILSHDGGIDRGSTFNSGFFLIAEENKIYPLIPHNLCLGYVYSYIGMKLGLEMMGQAGKLMGLSSYGSPAFFKKSFIGNAVDFTDRGYLEHANDWFEYCKTQALKVGYDIDIPKSPDNLHKSQFCADLAASTQELFEKTIMETVKIFKELLLRNNIANDNLFMAGGVALNCSTNTKIFESKIFNNLLIPPWCNDTGLSLGAALYFYHNILDNPLKLKKAKISAYFGRSESVQQILINLKKYKDKIEWKELNKDAKIASKDLVDNKIVGWFEGGSEMGPRALGHRSILTNPMIDDNVKKLNKKKGRERWRPFGVMVLESEANKYFSNFPMPSPHMLFTALVKSDNLPAITHVDHSSRIQTVTEGDGFFYTLLCDFFKKTGIPMLLNTSFNKAGEPIIETSEDAIKSFVATKLDVLYISAEDKLIRVLIRQSRSYSSKKRGPPSKRVWILW